MAVRVKTVAPQKFRDIDNDVNSAIKRLESDGHTVIKTDLVVANHSIHGHDNYYCQITYQLKE